MWHRGVFVRAHLLEWEQTSSVIGRKYTEEHLDNYGTKDMVEILVGTHTHTHVHVTFETPAAVLLDYMRNTFAGKQTDVIG